MSRRGALIILEGGDRVGKTTQAKYLIESLNRKGYRAQYMNFPNRTTGIGKLINSHLMKEDEFNDETVHLLFASNRWEAKSHMEKMLREGITLIVDRYSFSGVAFSVAKGLDMNWCKASEIGLLKPDLVLLLKLDVSIASMRGGYGDEIYEIPEFQRRVMEVFRQLKDDNYWKEIVVNGSISEIYDELLMYCCEVIDNVSDNEILKLW